MSHSQPLRKSKRIHNDTGYLGTLSEIVKLFSGKSLPTTSDIEERIVEFKEIGTFTIAGDDETNDLQARPAKFRRSAHDEYMVNKTLRAQATVPESRPAAESSNMRLHEYSRHEKLPHRHRATSSSRDAFDSNENGRASCRERVCKYV